MENVRWFANWFRQFAWLGLDGDERAAALSVVYFALTRRNARRVAASVFDRRIRRVPVVAVPLVRAFVERYLAVGGRLGATTTGMIHAMAAVVAGPASSPAARRLTFADVGRLQLIGDVSARLMTNGSDTPI